MRQIFISYRRGDSRGLTERVVDRLKARFPREIFQDVASVHPGDDFMDLIRATIEQANLFIAVIGPDWLSASASDGSRRLDNPTDPVRIEIETALQYDVPIIPLLVDGAAMPRADQLPTSMQQLASINALVVRYNPYFEEGIKQLLVGIRQRKLTPIRRARRYVRRPNEGLLRGSRPWFVLVTVISIASLVAALLIQILGPRLAITTNSPNATNTSNSCASTPRDGNLTSVVVSASGDGWAVGTSQAGTLCNIIVRYLNGKWSPFPSPIFASLRSVSRVSRDEAWAVGDGGVIVHYTNGKWLQVSSPTTANLAAILMLSAQDGWAVGLGTILHYTNSAWVSVGLPADLITVYPNIKALSFLSPDDGWASADPGTILHYHNGVWESVVSNTQADLHGLAMVSTTEGWAVGNSPQFTPVFDHYSGGVWAPATEAGASDLPQAISMASASDGWAVGYGGQLMQYTDGQWNDVGPAGAKSLHGIDMVDANTGWAVGDAGTILQFHDGRWVSV